MPRQACCCFFTLFPWKLLKLGQEREQLLSRIILPPLMLALRKIENDIEEAITALRTVVLANESICKSSYWSIVKATVPKPWNSWISHSKSSSEWRIETDNSYTKEWRKATEKSQYHSSGPSKMSTLTHKDTICGSGY